MPTLDAETLYNSLSSQWNYTTKPSTPQFIKLMDIRDTLHIINTNKIISINKAYGKVYLENEMILTITSKSMSHLLSALDCE